MGKLNFADIINIDIQDGYFCLSVLNKILFFQGKNYVRKYNPMIRHAYDKYKNYMHYIDSVSTLAVGSSHGEYGFIADNTSINMCESSQDLYYSYNIYHKSINKSNIKNILLFYSVFSSGFILEKCSEYYRSACYHSIYGFDYLYNDLHNYTIFEYIIKNKYFTKLSDDSIYNRGNSHYEWFFPADSDVEKRVKSHVKNSLRDNEAHSFVDEMAKLSYLKKHNFIIVIPPVRSDYYKLLPQDVLRFDKLLKTRKQYKDIHMLDLIHSNLFSDSDFGDHDHLNATGARKMTDIIFTYINTL